MAQQRQMEFFVLAYAPGIGTPAKINVGVVMFERTGGDVLFARARFVLNKGLILRVDPNADLEMLAHLFRDIDNRLDDPDCRQEMLQLMQDSFSNLIRVSDKKAISFAGDPFAELDRLASLYLLSEAHE